ncbi:nicotinate-nucleotide adenylyltransferase [Demequina sp. TTPB684]|uniref:nicotinate-nucleotide adenylyltransferase n=1 Tax=unclassified Demequina TaxID=2620311 RepID=UPI001CF38A26|nr:nicotinate-nucleotide adenylyltransferase [Demequina sp. TMPB413]MCB2412039.1 nicotinate-nucleotide adenylyltransferase [Demequina sp. TTPB684]UPU88851.1 nicotinate-nucleotide adenylyltransferase [Demequina sp. TMPB413]
MSSLRIGVLGGTFDPIHVGHLVVASEVCHSLGLDRVLLVPAVRQPFKESDGHATPAQRLDMCRLAATGDPRLEASDVDVVRGSTTYTVDTLTDLAAVYPDADFFFIGGADSIARLSEWRDPDRLVTLATFVAVGRPGYEQPAPGASHLVVEAPQMGVSSTEVRRRLRTGAPVRYLVPDSVADYITQHSLYLGGSDA